MTTDTAVTAIPSQLVAEIDDLARTDLEAALARARGEAVGAADPQSVGQVLEAVAIAAATRASVDAATQLTRDRRRPRPVPGVTSATSDPISQALLGEQLTEALAVHGAVETALTHVREALVAGEVEAARIAAATAYENAITAGLRQSEQVWEVVGTSGSAKSQGFADLWRTLRPQAARHPAWERQRQIGRAFLDQQ